MGLDRRATRLRRSFESADGIAASVAPHFATPWTAPRPNSLGRGLSILLVGDGRLEKPHTALAPSLLPHMPAR